MVSRKNGACQIIKASIAVFAPVALPMTLSIIVAVADNCATTSFRIIDQRRQIDQVESSHGCKTKRCNTSISIT
jgi:hypothetical protein